MRRKPTRRDLLVIVGRLQDLIGRAVEKNHDRNPDRYAQVNGPLEEAAILCIAARSFEPPVEDSGPWSDDSLPKEYI